MEPGSTEIRLNAIPINIEQIPTSGAEVKLTPVLQSVSQMKNFWVLTNLIQGGSNVYTIPKIESAKPGDPEGPTIIQSTDHQQFIINNPINITPSQTITIPTSIVESGGHIIQKPYKLQKTDGCTVYSTLESATHAPAGQIVNQPNIQLQVVEKSMSNVQQQQHQQQVQYPGYEDMMP
jgi:hypothetical protein